MTEATGYEARTIHRLLELSGLPDENGSGSISMTGRVLNGTRTIRWRRMW